MESPSPVLGTGEGRIGDLGNRGSLSVVGGISLLTPRSPKGSFRCLPPILRSHTYRLVRTRGIEPLLPPPNSIIDGNPDTPLVARLPKSFERLLLGFIFVNYIS